MRSALVILFCATLAFAATSDGTKYLSDYNWSITPGGSLGAPGSKAINLHACPAGVSGTQPEYWVYLSGPGTAEAALVTGGSCKGDGGPGTLEFSTRQAHGEGYKVGSASDGLQEASIAAGFIPTNPKGSLQSGKVVVPAGSELKLYARVSIRNSAQTLDFTGSILECYMADSCIFVGDPKNSNLVDAVTLIHPRGRAMVANGRSPFIEVNAQQTRIFNVSTRVSAPGAFFSSYVQVDDDQAFLLDGLTTSLGGSGDNYGLRCDAAECDPVVYAPGPFNKNSAVGWLKNLNIGLQCRGNGIDWQSGNTLRITDSVIQGYAQYGVRAGTRRGGYGGLELENVYEEVGNCANPAGKIGQAGVISQGGRVQISGGVGPAGSFPVFAHSGTTDSRYYIVAHAGQGTSNALYAGKALTNGSGAISVTIPEIAGADTFDLLRVSAVSGAPEQAPFGSGPYAVAVNVPRASACANKVCTFSDPQGELRSYSVATPTYYPMLDFWPGPLVLAANADSRDVFSAATASVGVANFPVVALQGSNAPALSARECAPIASWTPVWVSCPGQKFAPSAFYAQGAMLLAVKPQHDAGKMKNLKGRLNFTTVGTGPGHIVTLSDSNFDKTIATANNRPTNDAQDAYIGYDQGDGNPANIGISFGAPKSLSSYIGNTGDGSAWKERLTAEKKTFAVPVAISAGNTFTLGTGTALSQMKVFTAKAVAASPVAAQSCLDVRGAVEELSSADQIANVTPPAPLGDLSLNAYAGAGVIVLHFCNPSGRAVQTPAGNYTFLAVH